MDRNASSGPASASERDPLQVLEFWKEFDLDGRRAGLDQQVMSNLYVCLGSICSVLTVLLVKCIEMREAKTASIAGRKRLNEQTKAFRTLPTGEQAAMMNELLQSYQKEIDQLSSRSRLGESAFFSLYKSVYEAPDPTPAMNALSSALMESASYQLEIEKLKSEIQQYDNEFQQLKNQDITIRRLEDQIDEFKESIQDKVNEEVSRRVQEVEMDAENKIMDIKAAHYAAEKRLATAQDELKQSRDVADRCQNQLYELSDQAEKRVSAIRADMSIVEDDAERLRSRVAELERQLDRMKTASDECDGVDSDSIGKNGMNSLLSEFQSLQIVADELRQSLRRKEDEYRSEKARNDTLSRDLNMQLAVEKDAHHRASTELAKRPTTEEVESLKRQLRSLQRIAFNAQEDDTEVILIIFSLSLKYLFYATPCRILRKTRNGRQGNLNSWKPYLHLS